MSDIDDLATQILGLFKNSLQRVHQKLDPDDKRNLAKYAKGIAERAVALRDATDAAKRKKLKAEIEGFSGAINLMADRYLLRLNREVERTLLEGLKITAEWLIKIVIAAAI